MGKYAGQDLASMPTRARYRKVLRELAADGITPDPATVGSAAGRRNARRSAAGAASLSAIAGGAVALSLFPLVASSGWAGVAALALVAAENVCYVK